MFQQIFINCERIVLNALGNPAGVELFNTLSNILFFAVAYVLWRQKRAAFGRNKDIEALIFLIILIAIGSTLFHATAMVWAVILDVAPIIVFIGCYLVLFVRRIMGKSPFVAAMAVVAVIAMNVAVRFVFERGALNWAYVFFPTIFCLILMTGYLYNKCHPSRHLVAVGTVLFALSVFMRTIDMHLCDVWPYGLHFMWHVLNSAVLYVITRSMFPDKVQIRK